jgi:predicted kinase
MDAVTPGPGLLIVIRGNCGSGKSSVAQGLRDAYGHGLAVVGQDVIRRTILREKDRPGGVSVGLIDVAARYSLEHGFHVVVEGILYADRYEEMLAALRRDYPVTSFFFYLDVPLDETLRRHASRAMAAEVPPQSLREWYRPRDLLSSVSERVIGGGSALQQTIETIAAESHLLRDMAGRTP